MMFISRVRVDVVTLLTFVICMQTVLTTGKDMHFVDILQNEIVYSIKKSGPGTLADRFAIDVDGNHSALVSGEGQVGLARPSVS